MLKLVKKLMSQLLRYIKIDNLLLKVSKIISKMTSTLTKLKMAKKADKTT